MTNDQATIPFDDFYAQRMANHERMWKDACERAGVPYLSRVPGLTIHDGLWPNTPKWVAYPLAILFALGLLSFFLAVGWTLGHHVIIVH
jgi:hypothetical protein